MTRIAKLREVTKDFLAGLGLIAVIAIVVNIIGWLASFDAFKVGVIGIICLIVIWALGRFIRSELEYEQELKKYDREQEKEHEEHND